MATQPHTLLTKSTGTSFIFSALKTFLLLWVSEMEGRRACSVQLTTIPRAFKMFSLHIGHVQCSLSHGSTQALWKTCLGEQTRHIYNLQTIILRHENYFNALLNCFFKSAGQILELPASCANCSKKKEIKTWSSCYQLQSPSPSRTWCWIRKEDCKSTRSQFHLKANTKVLRFDAVSAL